MNDDGKPQNDMTQHDAHAHELIEQLNLLEAVDHRITPEHVAKRFRELLDDIGEGAVPGAAADGQPREAPGQMACDGQIASLDIALESAIADAQSKAKAAADELRCAQEAATAARQQAAQIVAEAQVQGDRALEQAVTVIRNARDQARRIRVEAEGEAAQIVSAADDRADEALQQAAKMVRDARQQSEKIISEAQREAEQITAAARDYRTSQNPPAENCIRAFPATGGVGAAAGLMAAVAAVAAANLAGMPSGLGALNDLHSALGAADGFGGRSQNIAEIAHITSGVVSAWQVLSEEGQAIQHRSPGELTAAALPADGQVCTMFAVDIVGFTRPDRDDDVRRYLHDRLYGLLEKAFDGSGIPWAKCFHEDRGDGALVIVPPGISAKGIIDPLPGRLRGLIRRHNHVSRAEAGLQLRAAVHTGPIEHDGHGFVSSDINLLFRMLEARPFKRAMAASGAELGLVVSGVVYRNLICRYPGLVSPDALEAVRFQTKNTRARAWVYLPGPRLVSTAPAADSTAGLRPDLPETGSESKFATSPDTPGQQASVIGPATAEDTMTSLPSQLVCDLWR